ncbi:aminoglycoside adenylyltransferase domain-containing protein [Nocardia carnea]|uniref:aminoglycoside adenylyltransferase domain-containing protein n=1 Tax=Nocardia carnea TaxID=37328 RepID=UPI0024547368|nr:aminoglycoside adenylyltransferase domain-containing protein [Nocardia carnea]
MEYDLERLPVEVGRYLSELILRVQAIYRNRLVSIGAVGSLALGDYRHGRSDIDITVVVAPAAPARLAHELADALVHPGLCCPAAGLELVVYDAGFAASGAPGAGYVLNLNTGPCLPAVADFESGAAPGFWYVIDRAIGHQSGWTLAGRPIREVLGAPARADLLAAVSASVREHASGAGHLADNRVLNGCRSVYYCETGYWVSKRTAGRSIAAAEKGFRPLVAEALRSFERPRESALELPAGEVDAFLTWVRRSVDRISGNSVS